MKIILLKKDIYGIIDLRNQKDNYLILDNINDFNQILKSMITIGINKLDYKYCSLENNTIIPVVINIKDDLFNQMQTFKFTRVRYSELEIDEKVKKSLIENMVKNKKHQKELDIEAQAIKLIIKKEFGKDVKKKLSKLSDDMDILNKEVANINYKNYLEEFV